MKCKGRHTVTPQEVENILPWPKAKKKLKQARPVFPKVGTGRGKAKAATAQGVQTATTAREEAVRAREKHSGERQGESRSAEGQHTARRECAAGGSDGKASTPRTARILAESEIIFYIYGVITTYRIRKWQKWSEVVHFARRE